MSNAPRSAAEPPYTGPLGATRREFVFVPAPGGGHRRVEVVRALNAVTDPALARQAADGALHRSAEHDLAVPFVYHDPSQRRFYLVVPAARAHEELTLRAELLTRLAAETQEVLPGYVREARAVVGPAGLRKALEEPARGAADPRALELTRREAELSQRERELSQREREVAHAEQSARARAEEHEAQAADLALREQELELRMSELLAREEALADSQELVRANTAALNARERSLSAREAAAIDPAQTLDAPAEDLAEEELHDDALEFEPDEPTGQHRPSQLLAAAAQAAAPEEAIEPEPEDASVEEVAELAAIEPEPEDAAEEEVAEEDLAAVEDAPVPQWIQSGGRPFAAVVEGEVRLWCQGTPETAMQLSGAVVPTLQVDPAGHLPLALLTVRSDRGLIVRAALDLTRPEDRAVIEGLARDFRVRVELVSATGRALGSHPCGASSEAIAQRALEVLSKRDPGTADARQSEAARLVTDGVRWSEVDVSAVSFDEESVLSSAESVEAALATYEPLLSKLRADRFALANGVSPATIESTGRRLVFAALRCGVLLSPAFVQHAVTHGVAADEKALAARALTAYARSLDGGPASIGRDVPGASRAWAPLLAWAHKLDVAIPDAVREAVAAVYDPDDADGTPVPDARPAPDDAALAAMDDAALAGWLSHPKAARRATRELIRRDPTKHLAALRRALRALSAEDLATLAPALLEAGDALADFWVELLASKRPKVVRVAAAAAGSLKLRRALTPLVQRTMAPDEDAWRLAGWAAGELGVAVVRAVTRLDNPVTERVAWVLAHAIRNGAAKEVERARVGANASFVEAATRSLAMQDEARGYDEALRRGEGPSEHERAVAAVFGRAMA